jgi:hypothetical protein
MQTTPDSPSLGIGRLNISRKLRKENLEPAAVTKPDSKRKPHKDPVVNGQLPTAVPSETDEEVEVIEESHGSHTSSEVESKEADRPLFKPSYVSESRKPLIDLEDPVALDDISIEDPAPQKITLGIPRSLMTNIPVRASVEYDPDPIIAKLESVYKCSFDRASIRHRKTRRETIGTDLAILQTDFNFLTDDRLIAAEEYAIKVHNVGKIAGKRFKEDISLNLKSNKRQRDLELREQKLELSKKATSQTELKAMCGKRVKMIKKESVD